MFKDLKKKKQLSTVICPWVWEWHDDVAITEPKVEIKIKNWTTKKREGGKVIEMRSGKGHEK